MPSIYTAIDSNNLKKLLVLKNRHVLDIVRKYVDLCRPEKVTVLTDSKEDINYVRKLSLKNKEEIPLSTPGHTVHFDGYFDQGRDKEKTKVLLQKGDKISKSINTGDRKECLAEILSLLKGIMKGKEMLVAFYCLGPTNSPFSIPALQITDSAYVAHSENILYRPGYKTFKGLNGSANFFHFVHSSGSLTNEAECNLRRPPAGKKITSASFEEKQYILPVSRNIDNKRIYIDLAENRVFSVNTQYAGNSVGLKKLALRLAIKKASRNNWLCEHMFLLGAKPRQKKRITYFAGAYPSACGKTSTAMIPDQTIVGDDITYIRKGADGWAYAANVEQGIFGIITDINEIDDPLIYKALTTPRELIFSNVLVKDGLPYWLGMGRQLPESGFNYTGYWKAADKNNILPAHPNARYTIRIEELSNASPHLNDPSGVPLTGIIYGGRDSDTTPPVVESFNWPHGVFIGTIIESETTAATLGKTGVRLHNPMANLDFLSIPLSSYFKNHLRFGKSLKHPPHIFTTNYFLKENGQYLNQKIDKKVWLMWMEGRIHQEFAVATTPIGYIPRFEDLRNLFAEIFHREYIKVDYQKQFSIRVEKLLDKLDRIEKIFRQESNIPEILFHLIRQQRQRLSKAKEKFQKTIISPFDFI